MIQLNLKLTENKTPDTKKKGGYRYLIFTITRAEVSPPFTAKLCKTSGECGKIT